MMVENGRGEIGDGRWEMKYHTQIIRVGRRSVKKEEREGGGRRDL